MRIYIIRRSLINENLGKDTLFCLYILLSRIFCRFKGLFCKVEIAIYVKILENARKSKKFCEKSAFFFRKSFVVSRNVRTFAVQSRNKGCLIGTEESIFYVLWSTRGYRRYISVRRKTVPLVTLYALGASLTCLHY